MIQFYLINSWSEKSRKDSKEGFTSIISSNEPESKCILFLEMLLAV